MRRFWIFFILSCALLAFLSAVSLGVGLREISYADILSALFGNGVDETLRAIIFDIRLPRLVAGVFCGAMLASAGVAMQALFRNPLADPSITGVSSGAALGAALAINFGGGAFPIQISALVFGLFAAFAIWRLGRINGRLSAFSMLLAGIAINAFCGALVGFLMYSVREAGVKGFIFWTLGSLENCSWRELAGASFMGILCWLALFFNSRGLNMVMLGSDHAYLSGANVKSVQGISICAAAVMTACAVMVCGIIGFVGLVVPHICRMLTSPDNRSLLPLSAVSGACLVVFSDIVSRLVSPLDSVPIGVVTALLGAPFFLYLLRRGGGNA